MDKCFDGGNCGEGGYCEKCPHLEQESSGGVRPVRFSPADCLISTHPPLPESGMTTGKIHSGIRVVHVPTGAAVECIHHRAMYKNKDAALKALKAIVEGI